MSSTAELRVSRSSRTNVGLTSSTTTTTATTEVETCSHVDRSSNDILKEDNKYAKQSGWNINAFMKTILLFGCGIVFGIVMHKANVVDPSVVRGMMLLQQFTMTKLFASGLATSTLLLTLLAAFPLSSSSFTTARNNFEKDLAGQSVQSSVLGGALVGIGITISGSCIPTIFPQLGIMVPNAVYTFFGGLLATFLYCCTKPAWDSLLKPSEAQLKNRRTNSPNLALTLPLVAVCVNIAYAFEMIVPSENEIKLTSSEDSSYLGYNVWPPYVAGIVMGGLQLPLVLGLKETLGGRNVMTVIAAQFFVGPLKNLSPHAAKFRRGIDNCSKIFYGLGTLVGAYISATASGTMGAYAGVSAGHSFVGGFLLFLGTRIGGGCTSTHALSGIGLLSMLSVISIASTFTGAIGSAFILRWLDML